MHKKVVRRYNLTRVFGRTSDVLKIMLGNQTLFSKKLRMEMLVLHWELDNLRAEISEKIVKQSD